MSYLKKGDYWPLTEEDRKRVKRYKENKKLFKGVHDEVFKNIQLKLDNKDQIAMTYLVANYCGLLSKISADMLFGEQPSLKFENKAVEKRMEDLIKDNNLYTTLYESALGNSYRGDACYKVRYAKKSSYSDERCIIIEPQNPNYYFVEQADDNIRQIDRQIIGWDFLLDDIGDGIDDTHYLKLEVHEPGYIYNFLYKLHGALVQVEVGLIRLYRTL